MALASYHEAEQCMEHDTALELEQRRELERNLYREQVRSSGRSTRRSLVRSLVWSMQGRYWLNQWDRSP